MLKLNFILRWMSYTNESVESKNESKNKRKSEYEEEEYLFRLRLIEIDA